MKKIALHPALVAIRAKAALREALTKKSAMMSDNCFVFSDNRFGVLNERSYWKAALTIQQRCAANGHQTACVRCSQQYLCSDNPGIGSCSPMVFAVHLTWAEHIARILEDVGASQKDRMDTVMAALAQTETMDDVQALFTPHPEIAQPDQYGFRHFDPFDPDSHFYLRCQELMSKEYDDLPFVIKWELVQNQVAEQHLSS